MSNGIGHVWAVNAEGGDASRPNGVGPVWIENADQLGSKLPEPEAGDTGKVLGVLNADGDIGWVPSQGEADLFYVTYNVTTFDEIKAAHDAGKWPVIVDSSGHFVPMVDFDWIGTASSVSYARFQTSTYLFHADTDGAGYYNVVYYLRLEIDPDWNRTETWSTVGGDTSADWNAVSGPRAIRNKPTIPSVDQTYNSASTNAQSGTAVAQAIAAIPSSSYTAGDGIAIDQNNEISVAYDSNTLDTVAGTVTITAAGTPENYDPFMRINDTGFTSLLNGQTAANVTVHIPSDFFSSSPLLGMQDFTVFLALYTADPRNGGQPAVYTDAPLSYQYDSLNDEYVIDEQDFVLSLPASGGNWYPGTSLNFTDPYIVIVIATDPSKGAPDPAQYIAAESSTCTITYTSDGSQALAVKNPLPASTVSDAGKILTVNSSGAPTWGMLGSVTSIQQVSALPATPDANTLYLIPEA